jgi:hypothetical protein
VIDVNSETIILFSELARRLPRRRKSRPTHVSTIHRWRQRGVDGVRLEAVRLGGTWVTSLEAYARFCDALTRQATTNAMPVERTRASDEAVLDALLAPGKPHS